MTWGDGVGGHTVTDQRDNAARLCGRGAGRGADDC